jgi:hypothetical protein
MCSSQPPILKYYAYVSTEGVFILKGYDTVSHKSPLPQNEFPLSKKMIKLLEQGTKPLIVAIDLEGSEPDILEVAAIAAEAGGWVQAKL